MVQGGMPPFAAAGMYILFGLFVLAVVILLQRRSAGADNGH